MVSKLETLQAEIEELRKSKEELRRAEEELKETMRYKEAELRRLLLQKKLSLFKFP
jgi:prefoldin subunit 5